MLRHVLLFVCLLVLAGSAVGNLLSGFPGDVIWRVNARWSVAAGATAVVGGLAWAITRRLADPSPDGPVTSPLGAGPRPSSHAPGPRRRLIGSIPPVAAALALVTLALLIWT